MTYARRHCQASDDAPARDGGARGAGSEQRARLKARAPRIAKRRAVARVRVDDGCGARWPHEGRLSGMPIESACGGAVGTAWRLLDARPGSSRDFPIADDRPWIVKRSRGQFAVVLPLMLPSMLPGLGATLPPRSPVRACETKLSLSATWPMHLPECRLTEEALPEDANAFGRGQRLLSCRRAASLPGLPLQCAYRTPRPGISTRGPRRASHRSRPKAGPRALRGRLDPNACPAGQTPGEPAEIARSPRVRLAATRRHRA